MNPGRRKEYVAVIIAVFTYAIFGFTFSATKQLFLGGMTVIPIMFWRMIITVLTLGLLFALRILPLKPDLKYLARILPLGLFEPCVYLAMEAVGIDLTTSAESGTIIALIPICVLVFSRFFLREQHTRLQVIGIIASVVGIIIVVNAGMTGEGISSSPVGYLCLFIAIIAAAIYNVLVKKYSDEQYSPEEIVFVTHLVGVVFFGIIGGIQGFSEGYAVMLMPLIDFDLLGWLLFLSLGSSVLANCLNNYAIGVIGPTRASSFAGITTIVSICAGALFIGEKMLLGQYLGAVFIIVGVWMANYFVIHCDDPVHQSVPAATEDSASDDYNLTGAEGVQKENTSDDGTDY